MEILYLDEDPGALSGDPVLFIALDGWTDAGRAGTNAAALLLDAWDGRQIGAFNPDALFDYRDRRPLLEIDRGMLGDPQWPDLALHRLTAPDGFGALLVTGAEPDMSWVRLCGDIVELAERAGVRRYVGLGSVPGPVPHTRPAPIIATASHEHVLEEIGRPHEKLVVPASCQVVIETALRDAGVQTLGLWARVPHYVAGEYPAGTQALLRQVASHLGVALDLSDLAVEVSEHKERLDAAAASSAEISRHITQLESGYDAETPDGGGLGGPLPTGDEIAAELQKFLLEPGSDGD